MLKMPQRYLFSLRDRTALLALLVGFHKNDEFGREIGGNYNIIIMCNQVPLFRILKFVQNFI